MSCASNYWRFESSGACVPATKHNFKNPTYGPRCDTFPKSKISQKNHSKADQSNDAETLAEVWEKAIQEEEDDIDVVYDELPAPPSAFKVEKAIEVLQQFTLFCDEGDDLWEVLSKVKTFTISHSKIKEIKNYQRLL